MLFLGGSAEALAWGAHGSHGRATRGLPHSASVHNIVELRAAEAAGASFLFVSPVFDTRSHPGARALGPLRFNLLARASRLPVIALGGMNRRRAARLQAYGWAAIDALTPRLGRQKMAERQR
jgi:thiamine-phosphate pyrophosphorylase